MFFLHPIAERGWGDRFPAAHLFQHAALDLFCQIDAVIFVHRFDHRFQQQGELVVAQLFGHGNDVDAQLLAQHGFVDNAIPAAARKTAEFPEDDAIEGLRFLLGNSDHPHKGGALFGFLSADSLLFPENICFWQEKIVLLA